MLHIFHDNWQSLGFREAKGLIFEHFKFVECSPGDHIIFSLLKLKSASLELLETRTRSFAFRIYQTDEVFLFFRDSQKYIHFESSSGYFSYKKDDSLIRLFNKKNPKFALRVFPDGYYKVIHLGDPDFTCYFYRNFLHDVLPKPNDDKLIKKALAFAKAYGL